jgi:maleylacetate reductase
VCLSGLRFLHDGPLRTRENPDDGEARVNCRFGSWLSAFGLQARVPVGASHAIGHVLGGHLRRAALFLHGGDDAERAALQPAGHGRGAKIDRRRRAPELDASDAFAAFIGKLGLPRTLAEVGVGEDRFRLIGEIAMLSIFTRSNPHPIREPADVVQILRLAA